MERKITLLITISGSFLWLLYWTGRFYKEWYFGAFGINYELFNSNFDYLYYAVGSWATIAVAISIIFILCNTFLAFYIGDNWNWKIISIIIVLYVILLIFFWQIKFDPSSSILKIFGSRDICIMLLGIASAIVLTSFIIKHKNIFLDLLKIVNKFVADYIYLVLPAVMLTAWVYLTIVAYAMGNYHGNAAIWEGKMGLRWCKENKSQKWWILVVKTNDGRNFLYDREKEISIIVKDEDIQEIDGRVTRLRR